MKRIPPYQVRDDMRLLTLLALLALALVGLSAAQTRSQSRGREDSTTAKVQRTSEAAPAAFAPSSTASFQ